ncbi:MAG: hypothetical protein K6D96_06985 [Acetatifactor sp.]|nr:hypothetical protein [Acetatifactor sp.]
MNTNIASAVVLSLLSLLTVYACYITIGRNFSSADQYIKTIIVFMIITVSMVFWPLDPGYQPEWFYFRYLGVFSPNPFHNATYHAIKPFAILLFLKFTEIEDGKREITDYILLSVFALLGVLAKPSFAFVFFPVMAVVVFADIFREKGFTKHIWFMAIAMIPSAIALIYQYLSVFETSDSEGGIHLGMAVAWHVWTRGIKMAFLKANFFPLIFLLLHCKDFIKNRFLRFSWYSHIVGTLSFLFLYEGGFRLNDANFSWGYMHGLFFVFMTSIVLLFKSLYENKKHTKWQDILSLVCLVPHVICGVVYFYYVLLGNNPVLF